MNHQYEVCLECDYPLDGLDEVGHCPECGSLYQKSAVRQAWLHWTGPPQAENTEVLDKGRDSNRL